MKKSPLLLVILALCLAAPVQAEEELAPGFNECTEKAESTADNIDCIGKAYEYWDKILNQNFKAAQKFCLDGENAEKCKKDLLKAQRLWIQYKEAMAPVIEELGGGGSMSRISANYFMAEETKRQAKLLEIQE